MTEAELEKLLDQIRGVKSTPPTKKGKRSTPKKHRTRGHGKDTIMSQYYICSFFDITTKIVYVCGGVGFTERLVDQLLEEEHELYTFDTKHGKTKYQIMSRNKRTSYGLRLEDFIGWKEIKVLRGTGDFHFMLHNHKGRKGVMK